MWICAMGCIVNVEPPRVLVDAAAANDGTGTGTFPYMAIIFVGKSALSAYQSITFMTCC
jgi:hypothetical protein